jgi:hypothetical protein
MIGWIIAVGLVLNAVATIAHAIELHRQTAARRRPKPGTPTTASEPVTATRLAPEGVDEQAWLKQERNRIKARVRKDFPALTAGEVERAADDIIRQASHVLARAR